jgi:hypothetical protein
LRQGSQVEYQVALTRTYIDGLFEQVYDSATDDLTYRHYILAGGARVGVETIEANSGGTVTADILSFYVLACAPSAF